MPTNRPFLSNFLAAFRAHSTLPHTKTSSPSTQPSHPSTSTSPSSPRTITTSATTAATTKTGPTAALTSLHASPLSRTPEPAERSAVANGMGSPVGVGGRYMAPRTRRESDSSSEGFRDVLGAEKWYIGGRTAGGEERYFKLGVIRRQRSRGSLSLDRLSL